MHTTIKDQSEKELLQECHYKRLSYTGRSNLYSLAIPDHPLDNYKDLINKKHILAALSDGVYILNEDEEKWSTIGESVDDGDKFISLDACYPTNFEDDTFLICYAKASLNGEMFSINFAKLKVEKEVFVGGKKSRIEVINRYSITLEAAVLKITHIDILNQKQQPSFIVCMSNQSITAFSQKDNLEFEFEQVDFEKGYKPLSFLMELETNILSLTFKVYNDLIYVAGGCQDGSLVCTIIKTIKVKNKIKSYENTLISKSNIFYPISSLVFFIHLDEINLLVTTAVNLGLIYKNLNLNLSSPVHLTLPFDGDSILCATLADIDLDGVKEILLGTYNQLLLVYKLENERYVLAWQKRLPYPIYGIIESDFDGDGLKELVILTMYGLHVMKPNLNTAKKRILSYLHYIHKNFELTKP